MLSHFSRRITEKAEDKHTAPVLIVPFGDSVTQGCFEIDHIDHEHVYHNRLKQMLEERYPQTTFSVLNAGCGGETALNGLKRLERDIIRHAPDLVLVGFALNDACAGLQELDQYATAMRDIIDGIRRNTSADIIILSPNFMATHNNSNIAPAHHKVADRIIRCQNDGILKRYVETLRKLASEMQVPLADVYAEWEQMAMEGIDTTSLLSNGLNHPDIPRQQMIADKVFELICQLKKI